MADDTYLFEVRAQDLQGNYGAADSHSWTLATAYAGTLPASVGALNGWSLASPWTILYNFDSATVSPTVPPSVAPGSVAHGLIKWGSDATATKTADGQSGYADQSGYTVNTNQDFVIQYASAAWKFSATVPTCYLMTFRIASTPAAVQTIFGGSDGAGGGWYLEAHETAGIRAMIGTGAVYVAMSHVGGTNFYDNEYHTVLLVIDDASGKAKLYTEFGNTESTSMTIASGNAICTIGPVGTPYHWSAPTTYLTVARGEHPLLYTNAQSLFDEYEDARLNNVNQTAIAGLPTTIAALNADTSFTFTNAYNFSATTALAPMTGSAGPNLSPFTGTMVTATTGTQMTLSAAPQVRTSFTSQACATIDSAGDNLWGAAAMPHSTFTMIMVTRGPASHPGGSPDIMGVRKSVAGTNEWRLYATGSNVTIFYDGRSYGVNAKVLTVNSGIVKYAWANSEWNIYALRRDIDGGYNRMIVNATAGNGTTNTGTLATPQTAEGGIGRIYESDAANTPINASHAMWAWSTNIATDGELDAMVAAMRWKYGL
ncbi:MAG: hypothetical protein IPL79_20080 [Myxococcales bacterium]|nr:hypothetical protein [Myxococcales bacterium]